MCNLPCIFYRLRYSVSEPRRDRWRFATIESSEELQWPIGKGEREEECHCGKRVGACWRRERSLVHQAKLATGVSVEQTNCHCWTTVESIGRPTPADTAH